MKKFFKKRTIIWLSVVVCAIAILSGGTLGMKYLAPVYSSIFHNRVSISGLEVTVHQVDEEGNDLSDGNIEFQVHPGDVYDNEVTIENTSDLSCFVRVKLIRRLNGSVVDGEDILLLDIDYNNWIYNEADGYYYYKRVLPPDKITPMLFSEIEISGYMLDNEFLEDGDINMQVVIMAEAVQSNFNGTDPLKAQGWPT